jgi:Bacterial Ig-like domain (group 1)
VQRFFGRIGSIGAALGALAVFTGCGGDDLTLPGDTGPASISKVDGDNQTGPAGAELANPLIVQVVDQRGFPVADQPVAFAVVDEIPGSQILPSEARTGDDGTATARWVLGATSGSQQVLARVVGDGVPDGLEATFQAIAGSAAAQRIGLQQGDGQSGAVGTALNDPLVVLVSDPFGNPVAGVEVDWTADNGSVDPSSSTTGADGRAETSWVLGSSTGPQTATASSPELDGSPVTFTATANAGSADKLVRISGDKQSGRPGEQLAAALVVRLVDRNGNGVPHQAVSWLVGTGGGSVSSASSSTNDNGQADTRWTLGSSVGTNTLNAVVSGVGFVTFTAAATTGGNGGGSGSGGGGGGGGSPSPTRLAFAVQPSDTPRDDRISPAIEVAVLDQRGDRVTAGDFEVKLELQGDHGKLEGHSTQRTRSGVARFDDLSVDEEGEYRLRASSNQLTGTDSRTFEILKRDHHDHHDGGKD